MFLCLFFNKLDRLVNKHEQKLELSRQNRRTNFVVTNFCLVCGVGIQIFKGGKFCRLLNIALIIFHLLILYFVARAKTSNILAG